MVPPAAPSPGPERVGVPDEAPPRSPRQRFWIAVGVTVGAASMLMWFYLFFGYDPGLKVDELADRTFPNAAQEVCERAEAELARLPPATAARTPDERADTVDEANAILTSMVDELEPLVPASDDRINNGIRQWLGDWRTHISDRDDYARALREDPGAPFLESTKGNRQVSRAIDGFAEVNRMDSCAVPSDVG